jgi:hypothetical protein
MAVPDLVARTIQMAAATAARPKNTPGVERAARPPSLISFILIR